MTMGMHNKLFVVLYGLIALVCCCIAFSSGFTESSLVVLGYCSTIILFSFLFCDYKINNRFTYSALFVLILYLFHFGQLMLLTFFSDSYEHVRFLLLLNTSKALYGFRTMLASLTALCFGILLISSGIRKWKPAKRQYNVNWVKLSKRIIYTTFFVKLGLDVATLYISLTAGGETARIFVNTFPNILLFYGKISLLGFAILLVSLKHQPQKQRTLFLFIIGYILIMMVSGIRSENVGYLAVFLFIYLQSRLQPMKVKQLLMYVVLGFFGLTFIVAVGQFRDYTNKSFDSFTELTNELLTKKNVILGLFDTCGDTGYTAQETLNEYLPKYGPSYGDAYYKGVTAIIPNLMPSIIDVGKITESSSTPIRLQKTNVLNSGYENIGGSFFAELYMNFGDVGGIIMCFVWGLFFGYIGKKSAIAFETNNIYQLLILFPIMFATVYWVRSYFGGGIREVVWDILFGLFILKKTSKK